MQNPRPHLACWIRICPLMNLQVNWVHMEEHCLDQFITHLGVKGLLYWELGEGWVPVLVLPLLGYGFA